MDLAPVIAMNYMCYKFFLYFSSFSRWIRTLWIRHCIHYEIMQRKFGQKLQQNFEKYCFTYCSTQQNHSCRYRCIEPIPNLLSRMVALNNDYIHDQTHQISTTCYITHYTGFYKNNFIRTQCFFLFKI